MVAKLKSSFFKSGFQLFCYKNFLTNANGKTTCQDSSSSSSSTNNQKDLKKLKEHSKSSPNLNCNNINLISTSSNQRTNAKSHTANRDQSLQRNSSSNSNNNTYSTNNITDKTEFYLNNRKQLSKIINGGKLSSSSSASNKNDNNNINKSQSTLVDKNKTRSFDSDLKQKATSHENPNNIRVKSATLPANSNSNNLVFYPPNNDLMQLVNSKDDTNNNRHSYTPVETSSSSTSSSASAVDTTTSSNSNKISSFKTDLINNNSNGNSHLYKNQSIASLKMAKKIQLMNKLNTTNEMENNADSAKTNGLVKFNGDIEAFKNRIKSNSKIPNQINQSSSRVFKTNSILSPTSNNSSILNKDSTTGSTIMSKRSFSVATNSKKVVRFADALGLELESIITVQHNATVAAMNTTPIDNHHNIPMVRRLRFSRNTTPKNTQQSIKQSTTSTANPILTVTDTANSNITSMAASKIEPTSNYENLNYISVNLNKNNNNNNNPINRNAINNYYNLNGNYSEFIDSEYYNNNNKKQQQTKITNSIHTNKQQHQQQNDKYDDIKFYDELMSHIANGNQQNTNTSNSNSNNNTNSIRATTDENNTNSIKNDKIIKIMNNNQDHESNDDSSDKVKYSTIKLFNSNNNESSTITNKPVQPTAYNRTNNFVSKSNSNNNISNANNTINSQISNINGNHHNNHFNHQNNHQNGNITIKTRINNGKLESEV